MAKEKTYYQCQQCQAEAPKWQGQCPQCHEWNTLEEQVHTKKTNHQHRFAHLASRAKIQTLSKVQAKEHSRLDTGLSEFNRVLGGGLVQGGVVLIGGDPGIGKSTLLIQAISHLSQQHDVLYITGEESAEQVAMRAKRLEINDNHIQLLAEIELETIQAIIESHKPQILVIDSIQTLFSNQLTAAPGSVSQVKECAAQLTRIAKQQHISLIMIGHVTKDGTLAGPRVLEHIVDSVLYFEGDTHGTHRLIRAFKNRFGAVNELGVFAMTDKGLKGVSNPSAIFLSQFNAHVSGACVMATQEGTRPLLIEIQSLVDKTHTPNPKRLCLGLEGSRLAMLLAVLHRHANLATFDKDVFINAVGGVKITETAADLPILLSIISSMLNKPLPEGLVAFGEIGLTGEIRPCVRGQERLKEAEKLGFTQAIIPAHNQPKKSKLTIHAVSRIEDVFNLLTLH